MTNGGLSLHIGGTDRGCFTLTIRKSRIKSTKGRARYQANMRYIIIENLEIMRTIYYEAKSSYVKHATYKMQPSLFLLFSVYSLNKLFIIKVAIRVDWCDL